MPIKEKIYLSLKTSNGLKDESICMNLNVPQYTDSSNLNFVDKTNYLVSRAFQRQANNERQGTRNTKTRAEVRGGGRKPWKQKGTGRARAGSNRSPLWKGGGVIFGPKPKKFSKKLNRKEWRLSLNLVLLKKQKNISLVESLDLTSFKTKELVKILKNLNTDPLSKIIIVIPKFEENLRRASKNIKNIKILQANCLNLKDVFLTKHLIITKESLKIIEETYTNE